MHIKFLIFATLGWLSLLLQPACFAEAGRLCLQDLIKEALGSNKELAVVKKQVEEAEARLLQSGNLKNPEISANFGNDKFLKNEGENSLSLEFSQKLPLGGRLAAEKNLARLEYSLAKIDVSAMRWKLVRDLSQVARALLVERKKLKTLRQVESQITILVEATEKRFRLAEVSEIDTNLSRAEKNKVSITIEESRAREARLVSTLNRLLGRSEFKEIAEFIDPVLEQKQALNLSVRKIGAADRPDLQAAEASIRIAKAQRRLAEALRFEDLSLGFEYSREKDAQDLAQGNQYSSLASFRVGIELPLWQRNQGKIAEALHLEQRHELEKSALELRIKEELSHLQASLTTQQKIQLRYQSEILPLLEKNLNLSKKNYASGLLAAQGLIQALEQYLSAKLGDLDNLAQLAETITQLEFFLAEELAGLGLEETN